MPVIGALILAAGNASRFGSAKQFAPINGSDLLSMTLDAVQGADLSPVLLVYGAYQEEMEKRFLSNRGVELKHNDNWESGIGSSIQAGIQELSSKADAVIICVSDQPYLNAELLIKIKIQYQNKSSASKIIASKYADSYGVPALFDKSLFPELLKIPADKGAKALIAQHLTRVEFIDFPKGHIDIDTVADLKQLKEEFSR